MYEPHSLRILIVIIVHAQTVPYTELPSNKLKQELRSTETVFYIAFVIRYCR